MADLLLIVRLAGRRVAFPAVEVEGVVELEGLVPAPRAAAHVVGLSALRSRVLTVIDAVAAMGFAPASERAATDAIVVPSDGHNYALLVDSVEDVVEASAAPVPLAAPPGAGWERVAAAMVEAGGDLLLLIDPHRLIAGPTAQAA
jgi:purine-binding chemotaxis protein CheW